MKPSNEDKKCDNTSATNIAESAAADGGGVVAAEVADSAAGSNPPNKPYHGVPWTFLVPSRKRLGELRRGLRKQLVSTANRVRYGPKHRDRK
tara:strand:+ start:9156 stop:9431 length:276 start_codon:yes stop_codon:yes gene_type:complete